MKTAAAPQLELVLRKLKHFGLLLESDSRLPSVCTLITGEPLRGSWWAHPLAQTIFRVNEQLADHRDVLTTKLISGKVTFVHRKLWSEVLAIARSREAWQTDALSSGARRLLRLVDQQETLRTDNLTWPRVAKLKPGEAARELEKRLLVHTEEFHTESGAHAKLIETWERWAKRTGFTEQRVLPVNAKRKLAEKLHTLNEEFGTRARFPWSSHDKTT